MMMERRRPSSFPLSLTKDNRMESTLRIAKSCLPQERRKLDRRVPWTTYSDYKQSHENLPPKNGSIAFDRSRAAMVTLEMMRREPLLVLTDVLKTKLGRDYIERMKRGPSCSSRSGTPSRKASIQTDLRSWTSRTNTTTRNNKNRRCKSETLQRRPRIASTPTKTPTTAVKRKTLRNSKGKSSNKEEENNENESSKGLAMSKNIQEDEEFAEVVDCELLVSCEPAENSKGRIKNKWSESAKDANHSLSSQVAQQQRKRKDSGSHCNGTSSPKRQRESVLRLTGDDRLDAGPPSGNTSVGQSEENLEGLDPSIVQFTVGGGDHTEVSLALMKSKSEDVDGRSKPGLQSSKETTAEHSDPIVLSSDEEETRCSSKVVKLGESVIRGVPPRRPKQKQVPESHSTKVVQVGVENVPRLSAHRRLAQADDSITQVSFSQLYCGGSGGRANGFLLIKNQEILIPLKDKTGHQRVLIRLSGAELRKYSIWEQSKLENERLCFKDEAEPYPVGVLLLFVSESAATIVHNDLCRLHQKDKRASNTGEASPFILMTLADPLEGVKGAILRSVLEIECLNAIAHNHVIVSPGVDKLNGFDDLGGPNLSLDESLTLIKRTGRDSHLLSMLGIKSDDSSLPSHEDRSQLDEDKSLSVEVQQLDESLEKPHRELQKEPEKADTQEASVPETTAELATESSLKTSENQQEAELQSTEKQKEEPAPVYTLAHRRVKNAYCVSLCKRDSHWVKYKHKGLPRRLIQFPPPPLKGGITVTLEDLQCLDNGQFLNDVIIDFYLKYLLQKVSAAVAERCHIFSSFFYKQLTRRNNASEGSNSEACQRQRRHQRVKTWTRHVDIFKKDFLFVPVNQEAHWYLVVICFPGLEEPKAEDLEGQKCSSETAESEQHEEEMQGCTNSTDGEQSPPAPTNSDTGNTQTGTEDTSKDSISGPVDCTESTCQRASLRKRPCILIMDSLKLSLHERVFKLLRDYLQSEWEVRRGSQKEFGNDQMKSSHCRVPLQDNSSDCGLYLLQYVECFLKDPVAHFELPLNLEQWFSRQQVRRKREEIRELILYLYRHQNLEDQPVDALTLH